MTKKVSRVFSLALLFSVILFPMTSHAYIGPGTGLSAIGALVALVATVLVAIFGFVWYPLKRVLGRFHKPMKKPAQKQ